MKNLKLMKYACILFVLCGVGLLGGCNEEIGDFRKTTGPEASNSVYIDVKDRMITYSLFHSVNEGTTGIKDKVLAKFPVHTTLPAVARIAISFKIDNTLTEVYNAKNGTNYLPLMSDNVTINHSNLYILEGETVSTDSISISYTQPFTSVNDTRGYVLPVRIVVTTGADVETNYNERVAYIVIDVTKENGIQFDEAAASFTNIPPIGFFSDLSAIGFSMSSITPVENDTKVHLAVNNQLIDIYNQANGTNFQPVPEDIAPIEATIPAGTLKISGAFSYTGDITALTNMNGYLIPLEITSIDGQNFQPVNERRVFYVAINNSDKYAALVGDDSTLGVRETDRGSYNVVKFTNKDGNTVSTANGVQPNGMFSGNFFAVMGLASNWLDITIDLGTDMDNITGFFIESSQNNAGMSVKALDVYYATADMYPDGNESFLGNLHNGSNTGIPFIYAQISEPIKARYIILKKVTPAVQFVMWKNFYVYTSN
ncbi:MAG: DUF1735 domain-containing protein [Prevotella sp.]|jgi:hypothetical protein|nr:DUF1735 domain-containing protein [Prevotella sp.]MDR2005269.1 DUF1735 domain-containing protein [Prevotella sp.]